MNNTRYTRSSIVSFSVSALKILKTGKITVTMTTIKVKAHTLAATVNSSAKYQTLASIFWPGCHCKVAVAIAVLTVSVFVCMVPMMWCQMPNAKPTPMVLERKTHTQVTQRIPKELRPNLSVERLSSSHCHQHKIPSRVVSVQCNLQTQF